jgi:hypothetical protein
MPRVHLIAASDDFLLEERLTAVVDELGRELAGAATEVQGDDATPESVATELVSPSLFAADRVLVVPDAREWLGAPAPPGLKAAKAEPPDPTPLIRVLAEGVPEGVALVLGAWCGRKPTGELADALAAAGQVEWIGLPPPPKPWEDAVLSDEQRRVLESLLARVAGPARFSRRAIDLLFERLGFAPRMLVQEVRKLAGAAAGGEVDEDLVRRLTSPKERSLEVVRDAVLERRLAPLLDLVAAAASGAPINDWQGQRLEPEAFQRILYAQVANLQLQLLYLRRVADAAGLAREMAPERTGARGWYGRRFKPELAPELLARLADDAPSPLVKPGSKPPSPWTLGALFAGAGRYTVLELAAAVASAGEVEVRLRVAEAGLDTLTAWLAGFGGDTLRAP